MNDQDQSSGAGRRVAVQPEIPRSRFARGMLNQERNPFQMRLGRFSDGQETLPPRADLHRGRFSEGQEALGDRDPEKHIRRRFSEGLETLKSLREEVETTSLH